MRNLTIKFIYYTIGTICLSLGITLAIFSNFGAGAFDAQNSNLSNLLNISIGQAMYISILTLYIITMILKPKTIYIVGVFLTSLVGFGIDIWSYIVPESNLIWLSTIYFIGSLFFLPLGVTFIIKSRLPLSPIDNLLIILDEKTKFSVGLIKTFIETSFALLACLFGFLAGVGFGTLSIGTIIITFSIGPGIEFFKKYIKDI